MELCRKIKTMSKKSFILHIDSLVILNELTNEQKGILFDAIYRYHLGEEIKLDFGMKMAFIPFQNQFIRDNERYLEMSGKNSENGKRGGRPRKSDQNPKNPTAFSESEKSDQNPTKAKKAYSDSVNDNVSINDNIKENVNISGIFPKFSENFAKKWQTWLSHLTEKGKSPTIGQIQEQIMFLNQYPQNLAEQIISTSLNGGYTALYKPKDTQVSTGIGKRPDGLKKTK